MTILQKRRVRPGDGQAQSQQVAGLDLQYHLTNSRRLVFFSEKRNASRLSALASAFRPSTGSRRNSIKANQASMHKSK